MPATPRAQFALATLWLFAPSLAAADFTEFDDYASWSAAAEEFATIGFFEISEFTVVTDEYEEEFGVVFQGNAFTIFGPRTFLNDGWGLSIFTGQVLDIRFSSPQTSIAAQFPGHIQIDLYSDGELIYASSELGMSGIDNFGGIVSSVPFDCAIVYDGGDFAASLDDLLFGAAPLVGDLNDDNLVNVDDLVSLIISWGPCEAGVVCSADLNGDGTIDATDLALLIVNWS